MFSISTDILCNKFLQNTPDMTGIVNDTFFYSLTKKGVCMGGYLPQYFQSNFYDKKVHWMPYQHKIT